MQLSGSTLRDHGLGALVLMAVAITCGGCALDFARYLPDARIADAGDRTTPPDGIAPDAIDARDVLFPTDRGIDAPVPDVPMPDVPDVGVDMGTDTGPPCGGLDQACCAGGMCQSGTTCSSGICAACGAIGGICCSAGAGGCASGATCSGGACVACGGTNQPCCDGTMCNGAAVCVGSTCRTACGNVDQPCCGGSACVNGAAACVGGMCQACGSSLQMCCPTGCGSGLACSTPLSSWMTGYCMECGYFGDPCCDGTACTEGSCMPTGSGMNVCLGNTGGMRGGFCATSGATCSDGTACMPNHYCGPCGGYFQPCCSGTTCRAPYTCSPIDVGTGPVYFCQ